MRAEKQKISTQGTPKPYIKHRDDGLDYVEEKYMRDQLNEHYPVWSWEVEDTQFLGSEWVIITGTCIHTTINITRGIHFMIP